MVNGNPITQTVTSHIDSTTSMVLSMVYMNPITQTMSSTTKATASMVNEMVIG